MFRGIGRWMMTGVMAVALQLFAGVASVSAGGTCPPGATYDPRPSIAPSPSIPPQMAGSSDVTAEAMAEWEPPENTFKLHSNTNATKTIYLDFTGHTGVWSVTTGYYRSYDFDGTFGSFSGAELAEIQRIWRAVAEDFLPFNVNVTTEEPPLSDLTNTGGADVRWGRRVVITSTSEEYDGGWAYVGDFSANDQVEIFICAEGSGEGYWNYNAAGISHEVGHSLGLSHDGQILPTIEYYEGHEAGSFYWTPFMGITWWDTDSTTYIYQWSKGEYANARTFYETDIPSSTNEDDLNIITTQNGFGYRTDDHGSTRASATLLEFESSTNVFVAEGIISERTDVDYFVFTMPAFGTFNVYFDPEEFSPNLDILATLYNSAGTVIAVSNPNNALNASFSTNLAAGTYYLSVDGTGFGTPQTGYSDYGSLGYYSIEGYTICDTNPPTPNPMSFAVVPAGLSPTSIVMTATIAADAVSLPVRYFFQNTNNSASSGWIAGRVWTNTSLASGVMYGYRVKARDAVSNETGWSVVSMAKPLDLVLDCSPSGAGNIAFSWTGTGFKLQTRTNLVSGNWFDCLGGATSPISVSMTNNRAFFRLTQ